MRRIGSLLCKICIMVACSFELSGQNISFSYFDIPVVFDVSPSFVSGSGGELTVSFGIEGENSSNILDILQSSIGSSGITVTGIRSTGYTDDLQTYEASFHIPSIPVNAPARTISFQGHDDLYSFSARQAWEEMTGVVSGIDHENLIPGQHFTIVVSGVERHLQYTLYLDDSGFLLPVETKSSSRASGIITFDVDEPGTYLVGNGSQFCRGAVHAYMANIFYPGFWNCSQGWYTREIDASGQNYELTMTAREMFSVEKLEQYLNLLETDYPDMWDRHLSICVSRVNASRNSVTLRVSCGPNLSRGDYRGLTDLYFDSSHMLQFIQHSGGRLIPFLVNGESSADRNNLIARLSGSQIGVTYEMVRTGSSLPGIVSAPGTGTEMIMSCRETAGIYDVYAVYDDGDEIYATRKMIGSVSMPPAMPPLAGVSQQEGGNWIKEYTFISADGQYLTDATYFNGLGFPDQNVRQDYDSSCDGLGWISRVTPIHYDNMMNAGAEVPLQYAIRSIEVARDDDENMSQESYLCGKYGDDERECLSTRTVFEASSRQRTVYSVLAGRSFQDAQAYKRHNYSIRDGLLVHTVVDEDGKTVTEETDVKGKIYRYRELCDDSSYHDIQYTYDIYDRLSSISNGISYSYDSLGRVAQKSLPGGCRTTYVYDRGDRVVLEAGSGIWKKYEYDPFGRLLAVYAKSGSWIGYDTMCDSLRNSPAGCHPIDDFGGTLISEYRYGEYAGSTLAYQENVLTEDRLSQKIRGLLTYEKHLLLDSQYVEDVTGEYRQSAYYYDYKGNVIQKVEQTSLGGILRKSVEYDFLGNPLKEMYVHCVNDVADTLRREMVVDGRGRIRLCNESLEGHCSSSVFLEYDSMGRVAGQLFTSSDREPHADDEPDDSDLTRTDYSYDIQGRLVHRGDRNFSQDLYYERPYDICPDARPRFNGISINLWRKDGGQGPSGYVYSYDGQGHLIAADEIGGGHFEHIAYSRDGRISVISRGDSAGEYADSLSLNGSGARPYSVTDHLAGTNMGVVFDDKGRIINDNLRGRSVRYNMLDLPCGITTGDGAVEFCFFSDGVKCRSLDAMRNGYEYVGPFVYSLDGDDVSLYSANMFSGRFVRQSVAGPFVAEYWSTDHLGSVRAIDIGSSVSYIDYYPYGTSWTSDIIGCGRNVVGFNSKEYQGMDSVSLYDYGIRFYDTRIGMWICPDPLLEQNPAANPYSFCTGDPVNRIDPDGRIVANIVGGVAAAAVDLTAQLVVRSLKEHSFKEGFKNIDWVDVAMSSAEGFLTAGASVGKKMVTKGVAIAVSSKLDYTEAGSLVVNSNADALLGAALSMATDCIPGGKVHSPKTASVNRTVNAARSKAHAKGKSFSADEAKQLAEKTRKRNAVKREAGEQMVKEVNATRGKAVKESIAAIYED